MNWPPTGAALSRGKRWAVAAAIGTGVVFAGALAAALWSWGRSGEGAARHADPAVPAARSPVWRAVAWPFPADPWGKGKAFHCQAEHCGTEVTVYLRAKVGMCGCITSIDDDGVESGSDLDLIAPERTAIGPGRPIEVRWMKGRSRIYAVSGTGAAARSAIAVAFHDRCDMIVATAALGAEPAVRHEPAVIEFLNSDVVLRWAETTLGL